MKINGKFVALAGLASASMALSGAANALVLTYDSVITSPAPQTGGSPWLTATITNVAGATVPAVQIVLSTSVSTPEFITAMFFSLNGGSPSLVPDSINNPDLNQYRCNGRDPAGAGPWQLCLAFTGSEGVRFDSINGSPYTLRINGVSESNFVVNGNGWYSAAHVQGISSTCSGWIGANAPGATDNPGVPVEGCGGTSVPEPGTLALLGLGLLGVGLARRRA